MVTDFEYSFIPDYNISNTIQIKFYMAHLSPFPPYPTSNVHTVSFPSLSFTLLCISSSLFIFFIFFHEKIRKRLTERRKNEPVYLWLLLNQSDFQFSEQEIKINCEVNKT